ncbi:hypothetical protein ACKVMT_05660 [Halobacteriales archaeon Cl-PHB]
MADTPRDDFDHSEAARMQLTPDDLHEGENGPAIDCPECGTVTPLRMVIREGRCKSQVGATATETASEDQQLSCTARLAVDLVWASD